jgi:hypothetical protein
MNNLAAIAFKLKRYDKAKNWYQKILKIRKALLGNEDKVTLATVKALEMVCLIGETHIA